jgi:ORF6N domain
LNFYAIFLTEVTSRTHTSKDPPRQTAVPIIPAGRIEQAILLIRGLRVMIDTDLAMLYGVTTRLLNKAVKRNKSRSPEDFIFQWTPEEN